jgi:hypothetical protein
MKVIALLGTVALLAVAPASVWLIGEASFSEDVPVPAHASRLDHHGRSISAVAPSVRHRPCDKSRADLVEDDRVVTAKAQGNGVGRASGRPDDGGDEPAPIRHDVTGGNAVESEPVGGDHARDATAADDRAPEDGGEPDAAVTVDHADSTTTASGQSGSGTSGTSGTSGSSGTSGTSGSSGSSGTSGSGGSSGTSGSSGSSGSGGGNGSGDDSGPGGDHH